MRRVLITAVLMVLAIGVGCNTPAQSPNEQIAAYHAANPDTPAPSPTATPEPPKPTSGWSLDSPDVNKMDGAVTQRITTNGYIHLVVCFKNGKPCSVPVAVVPPSGCFIESNVEGSSYSRRIRYKFDDGKPQTAVWGISDGHNGIFPHNSRAFIEELKKHKSFDVEFGCDESDPGVVTTMNIVGLEDSLKAAQHK